MNVSFTINNDAFKESETQKISNVYLVIEYDNPQAMVSQRLLIGKRHILLI